MIRSLLALISLNRLRKKKTHKRNNITSLINRTYSLAFFPFLEIICIHSHASRKCSINVTFICSVNTKMAIINFLIGFTNIVIWTPWYEHGDMNIVIWTSWYEHLEHLLIWWVISGFYGAGVFCLSQSYCLPRSTVIFGVCGWISLWFITKCLPKWRSK